MSTMEEEFICKRCQQKVSHVHFCTPEQEAKTFTCEYCGAKNVNHRHICHKKIKQLRYLCLNCGSVAVHESDLCNPIEIPSDIKADFSKIAKETPPEKILSCKICGQPVHPPGHYCDRKLPYTCKFCGTHVESNYHICRPMLGKFKFQCKNCGRLGIEKTDVCAPRPL
jgi:transcription elongation factor Elf1